ncbi:MAG: galactose mutarotase [Burkholderiales bacterium]|nr:galactose mutarotase [Burkholderiales bacterium]
MQKHKIAMLIAVSSLITFGWGQSITYTDYGVIPENNQPVKKFHLVNDKGMEVDIINYRAIITNLIVPGQNNKKYDVVFGYANLADYLHDDKVYIGASLGHFAGRIKDAKFSLDGADYNLIKNDNGNDLHSGGRVGFNNAVWSPKIISTKNYVALKLSLVSPDMDQGFPGQLMTTLTYKLMKNQNRLIMSYHATSTKDTVINLSNHSYYNLAGEGSDTILNQEIQINADKYLVTDQHLIPTGETHSVLNTPFDLRKLTLIGKNINEDNAQLKSGNGYDITYILNQQRHKQMTEAVTVYSPQSGITMKMITDEPALQFYSGNSLNKVKGKNNHTYQYRSGIVLEAEHYPDSPNHANFPSTELKKGKVYTQTTILEFSN